MRINEKGLKILMAFEGCSTEAYLCPANVWTIGFGHTGGVSEGDTVTTREAGVLLRKDLSRFEKGVSKRLKVNVTSNQFSALVCFAYNVGLSAFAGSTLLKKLNKGDYTMDTPREFLMWCKIKGKYCKGLAHRRLSESDLFVSK